jgi:benzoyl-CoA reductase/2-hydroxyglutaryl-CoA dehydratase subunit BcrC/BadD/HgdB
VSAEDDFRHRLPAPAPASGAATAEAAAAAARRTLERLAHIPERPRAMAAFDSLLGEPWRIEELVRDRRPVVGSFCNFMPEELAIAAGAIPIRLDLALAEAAALAGRVLPADVCPVVRSIFGAQLAALPAFAAVDLLVVPTPCDGKRKLVRALGEQRAVHMLALPQTREGERARAAWRAEIAALAARLEELSGRRIRRGPLRAAIELLNARSARARELAALRAAHPRVLSGRDAFLVAAASFSADPGWWSARAGELLAELEARAAAVPRPTEQRLRIVLSGSPVLFPDFQLLELVEGARSAPAVIVGDDMCSAGERLRHPTVQDEWTTGGMLRAAADRALLPCACPCFVSGDDRVDRLLELVRATRAHGVIHQTLRLCQLFDLELPRLAAALKAAGVPLLNVYVEHAAEDAAPVQNRVEAFLEMLQ